MLLLLPSLVEALRTELTQYGEMLALLEHQQAVVSRHGTGVVLNSIETITGQSNAIEAARQRRQTLQVEIATALSLPPTATFARLIPLLPDDYRPLLTALVQENNELLERVRECAQQNYRLMRHSLELMQQFIITLSPRTVSDLPTTEEQTPEVDPPSLSLYAAIL